MKYGYIRVSTHGQARNGGSLIDQREKLIEAGVAEQDIAVDVFTGTKLDRPGFDELLKRLQTGDELVVCKLDRFARTAAEGSLLVKELVGKGVRVNILNMGVADNTPMGRLMVTVLLAFAEYERDMIVERTQAGKDVARQRPDYREGRPRKKYSEKAFKAAAEAVVGGTLTQREAAEQAGMPLTTFATRYRQWRKSA